MVRNHLVKQVPHASDKRMVTIRLRPIDCFFLSFESVQLVVRMVFDYIIVNRRPITALGTGFYVNVRHSLFSPLFCQVTLGAQTFHFFELSTATLARTAEEYPYSSAHPSFRGSLDPVPQRLKPVSLSALPQA
jgi:hypothetical protein